MVPLQDVREQMQVEGIAGSIEEERNAQSKDAKRNSKARDCVNCMAEGVDAEHQDVPK